MANMANIIPPINLKQLALEQNVCKSPQVYNAFYDKLFKTCIT